jgi:hypothetical protein
MQCTTTSSGGGLLCVSAGHLMARTQINTGLLLVPTAPLFAVCVCVCLPAQFRPPTQERWLGDEQKGGEGVASYCAWDAASTVVAAGASLTRYHY